MDACAGGTGPVNSDVSGTKRQDFESLRPSLLTSSHLDPPRALCCCCCCWWCIRLPATVYTGSRPTCEFFCLLNLARRTGGAGAGWFENFDCEPFLSSTSRGSEVSLSLNHATHRLTHIFSIVEPRDVESDSSPGISMLPARTVTSQFVAACRAAGSAVHSEQLHSLYFSRNANEMG